MSTIFRIVALGSLVGFTVGGCASPPADVEKEQLQVGDEAVFCSVGTGSGNAPGPSDTALSCEQEYMECSDGHAYKVVCESTLGSGVAICTCYVDGTAADHQVAIADECPVADELVLSGCGWSP